MKNKKLVGISLVILVVLFMSLAYFYKSSQTEVSTVPENASSSLVRDYSMSFGENKKDRKRGIVRCMKISRNKQEIPLMGFAKQPSLNLAV